MENEYWATFYFIKSNTNEKVNYKLVVRIIILSGV